MRVWGGVVWSGCAGAGRGRGGRVGWRKRSSVVDILTVGCERRKIERRKRKWVLFRRAKIWVSRESSMDRWCNMGRWAGDISQLGCLCFASV